MEGLEGGVEGSPGYCFEKHDQMQGKVKGKQTKERSVCLGFLRRDSSSQRRSNGNRLTRTTARPGYLLLLKTLDVCAGGLSVYCLLCCKGPPREAQRNVY